MGWIEGSFSRGTQATIFNLLIGEKKLDAIPNVIAVISKKVQNISLKNIKWVGLKKRLLKEN